jgi:hypothetical protein
VHSSLKSLLSSTVDMTSLLVFPSSSFIGFVTDEEVKRRESKLREALKNDREFQIKEGTSVEIAQVRSLLKFKDKRSLQKFIAGHFLVREPFTCQ